MNQQRISTCILYFAQSQFATSFELETYVLYIQPFSLTRLIRASLLGYGSMSGETMIFEVNGASQRMFSK